MNKYAEKMLELIEAEKELRDIVNEIADKREKIKVLRSSIAPIEGQIGELEMDIYDLCDQMIFARRKVEGLKGVKP